MYRCAVGDGSVHRASLSSNSSPEAERMYFDELVSFQTYLRSNTRVDELRELHLLGVQFALCEASKRSLPLERRDLRMEECMRSLVEVVALAGHVLHERPTTL